MVRWPTMSAPDMRAYVVGWRSKALKEILCLLAPMICKLTFSADSIAMCCSLYG